MQLQYIMIFPIFRVIPNQHLEKISKIPLSHLNNSHIPLENITDKCQNNLDWNNSHQLSHFQNASENYDFLLNETYQITGMPEDYSNSMKPNIAEKTKFDIVFIKKYFEIWKTTANIGKIEIEVVPGKQEEEEKLDRFIEKLKNTKKVIRLHKYEKYEQNSEKSRSSYKNRFMVQKNIIDSQKAKLDEQNKVIEELKLGIIREDILKSIENTKTNIREIFAGSSGKIKCKVPVVFVQENKFNIDIQKAPKIIQQMEERSLERARNREIILERKRLIEEMRQKILEETIEKKRILEEEERKKNLQIMKENRRKELERERIRQQKRHIYEEKLIKAVEFHEKLLKQQCLRKLFNNLILSREKALTAIVHYRKKIQKNCLYSWMNLVESFYLVKYEIVDAHFSYKILRKCMNLWKEVLVFLLETNIFLSLFLLGFKILALYPRNNI